MRIENSVGRFSTYQQPFLTMGSFRGDFSYSDAVGPEVRSVILESSADILYPHGTPSDSIPHTPEGATTSKIAPFLVPLSI